MSYNADAIMKEVGISDEIVRDNFNKLNRMFNKEMQLRFGDLTGMLQNMATGGTPIKLHYQKVGRQITLTMSEDIEATKFNTADPSLAGLLPEFLRPRTKRLLFSTSVANAASFQAGNLYVNSDGSLLFSKSTAWTASATTLYATSVTYMGY